MMNNSTVFGMSVPVWILVPVIYFLWVTVLLFVKRICFKTLQRLASRTKTQLDDILIQSADLPLNLLIFTSGGAFVEQLIPSLAAYSTNTTLTNYFLVGFKAATIIAIVLFIDRFSSALFTNYSGKIEILHTSGSIARGFIRILVISLGFLILLDSFGVSITPIIASLGIGSLAVALALQPTLENFFSGVQIIIDKTIQIGHFIQLESGEEGYVYKIGWRSTWIRLPTNNIVVIPNSKLVNSKIINYYYPEKELAIKIDLGVHYSSDLEKVERVSLDVAREILTSVPGAIKEFVPIVRFYKFDSSSINFVVILRAKDFDAGHVIRHEFIKRLQKRYAEENITIPFPIMAVNLDQEGSHKFLQKAIVESGE